MASVGINVKVVQPGRPSATSHYLQVQRKIRSNAIKIRSGAIKKNSSIVKAR